MPKFTRKLPRLLYTSQKISIQTWGLLVLGGIMILSGLLSILLTPVLDATWWASLFQQVSLHLMTIITTIILFQRVIKAQSLEVKYEKKYSLVGLQEHRLKILVSSSNPMLALGALDELQATHLTHLLQHEDVNLKGANWSGAALQSLNLEGLLMMNMQLIDTIIQKSNLQNVDLSYANCQNADFEESNLRYSQLQWTALQESCLRYVNFEQADLSLANLKGANLSGSNLCGAKLQGTNLKSANLQDAFLKGCDFSDAQLSKDTILPDGNRYIPEQGLQTLSRFTNPKDSHYWTPEWVQIWYKKRQPPFWLQHWY